MVKRIDHIWSLDLLNMTDFEKKTMNDRNILQLNLIISVNKERKLFKKKIAQTITILTRIEPMISISFSKNRKNYQERFFVICGEVVTEKDFF